MVAIYRKWRTVVIKDVDVGDVESHIHKAAVLSLIRISAQFDAESKQA